MPIRILYEQQSIEELEKEQERLEACLDRISPRSGSSRKWDLHEKLQLIESIICEKKIKQLDNQK